MTPWGWFYFYFLFPSPKHLVISFVWVRELLSGELKGTVRGHKGIQGSEGRHQAGHLAFNYRAVSCVVVWRRWGLMLCQVNLKLSETSQNTTLFLAHLSELLVLVSLGLSVFRTESLEIQNSFSPR